MSVCVGGGVGWGLEGNGKFVSGDAGWLETSDVDDELDVMVVMRIRMRMCGGDRDRGGDRGDEDEDEDVMVIA